MKERLALGLCLLWLAMVTGMLLFIMDAQSGKDRSEAFRGYHFGLVSEGMSVLQDELSETNIRLSAVEDTSKNEEIPDIKIVRFSPGG